MGCVFFELLKLEPFIKGEGVDGVVSAIKDPKIEPFGDGLEDYDAIFSG